MWEVERQSIRQIIRLSELKSGAASIVGLFLLAAASHAQMLPSGGGGA
jgi:hypothetical protein